MGDLKTPKGHFEINLPLVHKLLQCLINHPPYLKVLKLGDCLVGQNSYTICYIFFLSYQFLHILVALTMITSYLDQR